MKILWFTWKDISHPKSGGAEVVTQEITTRLAHDGHNVMMVTSAYDGCKSEEMCDGVQIIRIGNRFSVYWKAYRYYKKYLSQQKIDIVIDEMNTIPFFASFYIKKENFCAKFLSFLRRQKSYCHLNTTPRHFLFVHQLCREIWFYQMIFPLNLIGYLIEPVYLWTLRKNDVITVSESTKKDLLKYGFGKNKISIISEGVSMTPAKSCKSVIKYKNLTMLSLGAIRKMKRTNHQLKAFEIAKKQIPELQFKIAGQVDDKYGKKVLQFIKNSKYSSDIKYLGQVTNEKKKELMQKSHIITVTSLKEGWGLIVSEAGSQCTPAIVYDVDGLRDAVGCGNAGYITKQNTPEELAKNIVNLLKEDIKYCKIKQNAWNFSRKITFDKSYKDFCKIVKCSM